MAYERRYKVGKFGGSTTDMTAKEVYNKVQEASADNELIAEEAEVLVSVCEDSEFPKCYAKKIKIYVLDSFTNLNQKNAKCLDETLKNACICYNSLSSSKKEEDEARQRYLKTLIKAIPVRSKRNVTSYPEKLYKKLCKKWGKEKFSCYKSFKKLNFERVIKSLEFDFEITLIQAENKGFFSEPLEQKSLDGGE